MQVKVTIRDVARSAGVSVATASRVLSGHPSTSPQSRHAVRQAARDLNFHANAQARSLRSARTGTIGVLLSDIRNPFFAWIAHSAEQAALAAGMATLLCNANESTTQQDLYINLLLDQRVDGIILAPQGDGGVVSEIIDNNVPLVFVDRRIETMDVPSVTSDSVGGIDAAVQHLAGLGHRRIGCIAGSQQTSTGRDRLEAFRRAIGACGLDDEDDLAFPGDFQTDSGRIGANHLFSLRRPPTAIIAADSLMTIGLLQACRDRGVKIGRQLSVVGFDDNESFAVMNPSLTVVAHDPAEMGARAVAMIRDVIAGKTVQSVVLPTSLVVRDSTGPVAP